MYIGFKLAIYRYAYNIDTLVPTQVGINTNLGNIKLSATLEVQKSSIYSRI